MTILNILIGVALLLVGRKAFWLFVAAIGFVVAMDLVVRLFPGPAGNLTIIALVAGLAAGVIGALLAVFFQQAAVGLAGFLAGGYIVLSLLGVFGLGELTIIGWVLALLGGILGFILALSLLDWALIVLSSLSGAALIAQAVDVSPLVTAVVLIVAVIVGVVAQAGVLTNEGSWKSAPGRTR